MNEKNEKKDLKVLLFNSAIFILVPLLLGLMMYLRIVRVLDAYAMEQVESQAEILGEVASRRISARMLELERLAEYLANGNVKEADMNATARGVLRPDSQLDIGVVRIDGSATSGNVHLTGKTSALLSASHGYSTAHYHEDEGILFTTPVYNPDNGNIRYVLYELFDEAMLFEGIGELSFDGAGTLFLEDSEEYVFIDLPGGADYPVENFRNGTLENEVASLRRRMNDRAVSAMQFRENGTPLYMFAARLEMENMVLVGLVPTQAVEGDVRSLPGMVLVVFVLLILLLAVGTMRVISMDAKTRESDSLREAKQAAEEAYSSKSKFLASMSHELRTPITTITGMNEMILRETREPLTKERANDIRSAVNILLGLINDVLDFSKIESGMLRLTPVEYNLATLIQNLALLADGRAHSKNLEFNMNIQPDLPLGLFGDDIRVQQIVANLLTNGVKYTDTGTVTLNVTGERQGQDELLLHFSVVDTGIGIKPEDIERLSKPYIRVDETRNHGVEGFGLGLSIVTNLLQLMNSELHIESVYGKGSTFSFDIVQRVVSDEPIGDISVRLESMAKEYEYRVSCVAPKARVLMVDDNAMNRKIFMSLMRPTKIQVTTVSSGLRCLELVKKEYFDLIFMDHLMPEMDGFETLQRLRSEQNLCRATPVIALTANAFSGAQEHYVELGFNGFLSKPIATEKLEALLCEMLPPSLLEGEPVAAEEESPAEEPAVELPPVDGINWDFARLHITDESILLDAARDFYLGIDGEYAEVARLAEHIDEPDNLAGFRIRAHTLKSSAAVIGALGVSELAKLLEYAAKDGETEKIRLATPLLLEALLHIKASLEPLAVTPNERVPLPSQARFLMLLNTLNGALTDMDISGADEVMKELRGYLYDDATQAEVDRLAGLVSEIDFDGAAECLNHLLAKAMEAL